MLRQLYQDHLHRDHRYYLELSHYEIHAKVAANKISQSITSTGLRVALQRRLRLSRAFKPWAGLGVGIFNQQFQDRREADSDGYLVRVHPDREDNVFMVSIDASHEWNVSDNVQWGVRLMVESAVDNSTLRSSLSALIWF